MSAWTPARKMLAIVVPLLGLGALSLPWVPLGFSLWLVLAAIAWAAPDPVNMREDETGRSLAEWGRGHRKSLLGGLTDVWRLGPPKPVKDKNEPDGLQPSPGLLRPVTYQSLAALLLVLATVFADFAVSRVLAHFDLPSQSPFDPSNRLPVAAVLGGLFAWIAATEEMAGRRSMVIKERECTAPPAVVAEPLLSFSKRVARWPVLAVLAGVVAGAGADYAYGAVHPVAGWWPFAAVAAGGLALAGWRVLIPDIEAQRAGWMYRQEEIGEWRYRWLSIMRLKNQEDSIPAYIVENDLPAAPDKPTHRIVAFQLQAGHDQSEYTDLGRKLASALGQARVIVEPYQTTPGVESWGVFTVSYELEDLGSLPHLNPALDHATGVFATRHAVISAFAELKLGRPILVSSRIITTQSSWSCIRESTWVLSAGVTVDKVAAKIDQIAEKVGCEWARTHTLPGLSHMILYTGGHPKNAEFIGHDVKSEVHEADWSSYMASAKLIGSNRRAPRLESITSTSFGLDELHFALPPGLDFGSVAEYRTVDKLASTSGYPYVKPQEDHANPAKFSLVIGEQDPLDNTFMFTDYLEQAIREPRRGDPDLSWIVGVGADGELIRYEWDHEEPHLLIAGGSGCGKSGINNSCLVQIFSNNHPDDVKVWMCEPKSDLQAYQHLAHVERVINGVVTSASPWESAAVIFAEAVDEMEYRNAAFSSHPLTPQKLSEAREIARKDPEGSAWINFPYLFLVIEECASYFAAPPLKEHKPYWDELNGHIAELARKSRSAGIYIIVITQYPTNKSIPQIVKQQCRRLGLKTADDVASKVIIDQSGLERIRMKGRGMISGDFGYEEFRGLLMDRPDTKRPDIPDDRRELIQRLPTDRYWPKLPPTLEPNPNEIGRLIVLPDGSRVQSVPMPVVTRPPLHPPSQSANHQPPPAVAPAHAPPPPAEPPQQAPPHRAPMPPQPSQSQMPPTAVPDHGEADRVDLLFGHSELDRAVGRDSGTSDGAS